MRKGLFSVETIRSTVKNNRAIAAIALMGSVSLGLTGCGSTEAYGTVQKCQPGWDQITAFTANPSEANTAMQKGIAELVNEIDVSGANDDNGHGYELSTIPSHLVGAANGTLDHYMNNRFVSRNSSLMNYGNDVCIDNFGSTYLTPAYLSVVGSLASAGINIDVTDFSVRNMPSE